MQRFITVAIDGTAASGKTLTALKIAEKDQFLMTSTGSYYPAISLSMMEANIGCKDIVKMQHFFEKIILGTKVIGNISKFSSTMNFSENEIYILKRKTKWLLPIRPLANLENFS
jgi:cytidylate kinase